MGIETELTEEFERAERREDILFSVLPYVLLAVATLITLLQPHEVPLLPALLLTVGSIAWMLWFVALHPQWHEHQGLMGLYYLGLVLLSAALIALAPWYGIFAFTCYLHAYPLLRGGRRYAAVVAASMLMAITYMGGLEAISAEDWWLWLMISLISIVLATVVFRLTESAEERTDKQRRALAELHEANRRLESSRTANAALQAQLLAQARDAGTLEERQRVSREIHDTLAQSLAGILTQLQAAEAAVPAPSPLHDQITTAIRLARESLVEARRTVHAVGPEQLTRSTLPTAIEDVAHRWSQTHRLPAELVTSGDPRPLHGDVESALLRSAQEALTNVAKHARAGRVTLTLTYMEDLVRLDVSDDGIGFAPHASSRPGADGGFGLLGMRQRLHRLSGELDVESEPGEGTVVSASVPVPSISPERSVR